MRGFFGKKRIEEDRPEMSGKVAARISDYREGGKTSKVNAILYSKETSKTVYKLRYRAEETSEVANYYTAENYLQQFARDHKLIIDGKPSTNVTLPFVRNVENKSGYSRR